jgi:hypothetical protein
MCSLRAVCAQSILHAKCIRPVCNTQSLHFVMSHGTKCDHPVCNPHALHFVMSHVIKCDRPVCNPHALHFVMSHGTSRVVQAHGHEILRKAEASHTIPLHEVRALQKMSFLREVKRRLFVVSVHCHGHLLYAAVQVSNANRPVVLKISVIYSF